MRRIGKHIAEERRVFRREPQRFFSAKLFLLSATQRHILLLTSFFFFTSQQILHAQKHQEDSLLLQLKKHPAQDLQHLKTLNALSAAQFWMINADAIATADKAIALAQKLNNQEQLAAAYNNKAFSLMPINLDETENLVQKAIAINKTLNNQTELAKNYTNMASVYYNKGEIEKGKPFRQAALKFADQVKDPLIKGLIYMNTGSYFRNDSNKDSALFYLHKANKFFEQAGHTDFVAYNMLFIGNTLSLFSENDSSLIYLNRSVALAEQTGSLCNLSYGYGILGQTYLIMANYPKALAYTLKSLRFVEKTKEKFAEVAALSNTGYIYFQLKKYAEAMEYNKKSLAIALEMNNTEAILSAYEEIGNVYLGLQNFNEALETYKKGLEIALAANFEMRIAGMHEHIGDVYQKLNQYTLALNSFKKAIAINQKTGNNAQLTRNYISIATTIKNAPAGVLTEAGINPAFRHQMAADYLKQALQLNKESGELEVQRDALNGLSDLYDKQNDFGNALIYNKQYVAIKDSIINTENSKSIANMQMQYESEKQQQQIASLTKDRQLHQTEIIKQKTQRNILMAACALVLVLIGFIVNRYQVKSKATAEIEKTYNHLLQTQQQLVQSGKLAALGKMTADVGSRIKEPIEKVKTLSPQGTLLANEYENATATRKTEILQQLKINLTEINTNGIEANEIVKDVLAQTRKQTDVNPINTVS